MLPPPLTATKSRRAIHVANDTTSVRRCRTPRCPAPLRRVPQSVWFNRAPTQVQPQVQPAFGLRVPVAALVRCLFPSFEAHVALGEIWTQDSRSHIAISYEPSIAWKASLRAHRRRFARPLSVLKPRWSQEPLNAASNSTVHDGWRLTITESHASDDSSRLLQACTC